jgi:hypothetical protein
VAVIVSPHEVDDLPSVTNATDKLVVTLPHPCRPAYFVKAHMLGLGELMKEFLVLALQIFIVMIGPVEAGHSERVVNRE